MKTSSNAAGHLAAAFTILIWGTTFISTKVLLRAFTPIEILFIRFLIGYLALWLVYPRPLRPTSRKQECLYAFAGLCGVTFYYLFENIALTFTTASNVGVIISVSPFFIAIFSSLFLHTGRPAPRFFIGFVLAMAGVCILTFQNGEAISLNPTGDFLALVAAVVWAVYAILTKRIASLGYNVIQTTRRTFFYGMLFMLPALGFMDFHPQAAQFLEPVNIGNLLFLGFGASALCFVTWNVAVKILGSVKTSVYIYMAPVITTVTSALILHERITPAVVSGIVLTLSGLFLSEGKKKEEKDLGNAKSKVRPGN